MNIVSDFRDFRGSAEDLICIIDFENRAVFWPEQLEYSVVLKRMIDGGLLAVYRYKGAAGQNDASKEEAQ